MPNITKIREVILFTYLALAFVDALPIANLTHAANKGQDTEEKRRKSNPLEADQGRKREEEDLLIRVRRKRNTEQDTFSNRWKTDNFSSLLTYVVGNHDDDLLSLEVLRHFVSESGVIVNRTKPDKGYIENPYARFYVYYPFNVYCEHGHKTDTFNYANAFGKIPPGRYVTAFLSSFLERLMDGEFGVSLSENAKRKYGKRPFARVDAIPNYLQLIHCLERDGVIGSGTGGDRPKQLIDEMNRRIDTIIDKKVAQDLEDSFEFLKGVATGLYDAAIGAIQVIKGQTGGLGRIKAILRLLEIIREGAVPTLAEAQAELKIQPGNKDKTQAVIMGHNHSPVVQPIVPNESIYINTGNWQDAGNFVGCQYNETRHRHVSILFQHSPHSVYAEQFVFFPGPQSVGWQRYNLKKSP